MQLFYQEVLFMPNQIDIFEEMSCKKRIIFDEIH